MIYVDEMANCLKSNKWRHNQSCHMYGDSLDELHTFALQIGLQRSWFQDRPGLPHYDLTENKRAQAVRAGATEHTSREMVMFMRMTNEQPEECDHDWELIDDSFDHEYGCEQILYYSCTKCYGEREYEEQYFDDDI